MNFIKRALKKYRSFPVAAKASLWFIFCSILQKGISFIIVPIFTRLLTTEEYGQVSIYQSWNSIISIFATLNLSYGVFNNGMTKYPQDRDGYTSALQGLSTVVTLAVFLIYLPFHSVIDCFTGLPFIVMLFMFGELLVAPAISFWSARQRYEYKYIILVSYSIFISVISPVIGVVAVINSQRRGIARIVSIALVNICAGLIFYIINVLKGGKFFSKEYWIFALKFNIPLLPHYLSMILLSQSDRIMIEKMFGETEVAIYSVATTFSLVMNIVTSSINNSYIPWTYQNLKINNIQKIKKTTNIVLIAVALISVVPIILAPELMSIIAPVEYADAIWIIPPISTSVFFTFVYTLFGNIEFYFEKTKFVMIASSLVAVSNIVLNALFMPMFGYMAAGYTTMACYIMFSIAHFIFMKRTCKKELGIKSVYDDKTILIISFAYLILGAIMMLLYRFVLIRYLLLLLSLVVVIIKRKKIIGFVNKLRNKTEEV